VENVLVSSPGEIVLKDSEVEELIKTAKTKIYNSQKSRGTKEVCFTLN
jgi:hypothetical protein